MTTPTPSGLHHLKIMSIDVGPQDSTGIAAFDVGLQSKGHKTRHVTGLVSEIGDTLMVGVRHTGKKMEIVEYDEKKHLVVDQKTHQGRKATRHEQEVLEVGMAAQVKADIDSMRRAFATAGMKIKI